MVSYGFSHASPRGSRQAHGRAHGRGLALQGQPHTGGAEGIFRRAPSEKMVSTTPLDH